MKVSAFKALFLASLLGLSSGCSLMLPDRSFIDEMEGQNDSYLAPGIDFPVVGGDEGNGRRSNEELMARTPASERTKRLRRESQSLQTELNEKEGRLDEEEMNTYSSNKKFLQSDSDKLYYLSLSPYERETYIQTKKQDLRDDLENKRNFVSRHSIHGSELYIGMDKTEVVDVWGKPARVEIAGNPRNQNERWSFVEDGSVKQVYFEAGKVHGWALDL